MSFHRRSVCSPINKKQSSYSFYCDITLLTSNNKSFSFSLPFLAATDSSLIDCTYKKPLLLFLFLPPAMRKPIVEDELFCNSTKRVTPCGNYRDAYNYDASLQAISFTSLASQRVLSFNVSFLPAANSHHLYTLLCFHLTIIFSGSRMIR